MRETRLIVCFLLFSICVFASSVGFVDSLSKASSKFPELQQTQLQLILDAYEASESTYFASTSEFVEVQRLLQAKGNAMQSARRLMEVGREWQARGHAFVALTCFERADELFVSEEAPLKHYECLHEQLNGHLILGDACAVIGLATDAAEEASRTGFLEWSMHFQQAHVQAELIAVRPANALNLLQKMDAARIKSPRLLAQQYLLEAKAYILKGATEKALQAAEKSLEVATAQGLEDLFADIYFTLYQSRRLMEVDFEFTLELVNSGFLALSKASSPVVRHQALQAFFSLPQMDGTQGSEQLLLEMGLSNARMLSHARWVAEFLKELSEWQRCTGDRTHSFNHAMEAIEISRDHEWLGVEGIAITYSANARYYMRDATELREQYDQAMEIFREVGAEHLEIVVLLMKAGLLTQFREHKESVDYMKNALKMSRDNKRKYDEMRTLCYLAKYAYFDRQYDFAKKSVLASIQLRESSTNPFFARFDPYSVAGQIFRLFDYETGLAFFNQSLAINKGPNRIGERKALYYFISWVYERMGDYKNALKFQRALGSAKDSLNHTHHERQISAIMAEREADKRESELARFREDRALQQLVLANQQAEIVKKRQYIVLLILAFLLLMMVSLSYFQRHLARVEKEKLQLNNHQLELQNENEKVRNRLEMAELRTEFFTNVSHEFRTPITLITGPLNEFLKRVPEHQTALMGIQRNAQRLQELVNETLHLAKLQNGMWKPRFACVCLAESMEASVESFKSLSRSRGISLRLSIQDPTLKVMVDESQLKTVMLNLLSNAFAHTKKGGKIHVKVALREEGMVFISVADDGEGIDATHVPHLFERFYRANPNSGKGSGIGLSICKKIAELHGGDISVESYPGKGSKFTLSLAVQPNDTRTLIIEQQPERNIEQRKSPEPAVEGREKSRILVIDDNEELLAYLYQLLSNEFHVTTARSGSEGLALAQSDVPELIITDWMMPNGSGLELTASIKRNLATSHIPVIVLTARSTVESKIEGLETGADDYLVKPFIAAELLQRCHNLIRQRQQLKLRFSGNPCLPVTKLARTTIDHDFLQRAEQIVERNLQNERFNVELFCRELAYNRSGVHVKLKALVNKNTTEFIRFIRLRKAAALILSTDHSMEDVAMFVGFNSRQAFYKAFKTQFHCTPSQYRRNRAKFKVS